MLTNQEVTNLKRQFGTSSWGGTRKLPLVFTENGIAMLSSVLNSKRAIQVNIQIMRTFTKLREMIATHKDLSKKLNELEKKKTVLKYQRQHQHQDSFETPEYLLEEQQFKDRLQVALQGLTEDQRTTFLLNRVEGKKHAEIAEMLGISQKAVEKRIYTALAKLRQDIKEL